MATPLANDAWTAKTLSTIEQTLGEIFDALARVQDEKDAAELIVRAGRFKDATLAWRAGTLSLTTEDLDALLDDVAALYGDVLALARRSTLSRDLRQP